MTIPTVYIVGADKGGVGKTMLSRALLDYLKANAIESRAFDTETPIGVLHRFFPDKTTIVDITTSDGQMAIFDTLPSTATPGPVTVIDIRAGLLSPTIRTLTDIGFLNPAKCKITILHVLGNNQASIDEVKAITESIASSRYIGVGNHINDTKYVYPVGSLDIPMLNAKASETVDAASESFTAFIGSDASSVLRGHTNHWLGRVFAQFDAARLNVL